MQPHFKESLLLLIENDATRIALDHRDDDFLLELAKEYIAERINYALKLDPRDTITTRFNIAFNAKFPILAKIFEESVEDQFLSEEYLNFLFLTLDFHLLCADPTLVINWNKRAMEKYTDSAAIKLFHSNLRALTLTTANDEEDPLGLMLRALKEDPEKVIKLQKERIEVTEEFYQRNASIMEEVFSQDERIHANHPLVNVALSMRYAMLADSLFAIGESEEAEKMVERALSLYQDNPFALAIAGTLMIDVCSIEAEKLLRAALDKANSFYESFQTVLKHVNASVYIGLAIIYTKRGIYDLAEKYYDSAINENPGETLKSLALLNRGRNKLESGDFVGAIKDLASVEGHPLIGSFAKVNLGKLYFEQGLYQKADSKLMEAIEADPDESAAYYNLGVLRNSEGKMDNARRLFQTAIEIDRDNINARNALEKMKLQEKKFTDWVGWWFGNNVSSSRKTIALALMGLMSILIGKATYDSFVGISVQNSLFIILGFILACLLLPSISKIKLGPLELEMQSIVKKTTDITT